MGSSLDPVLVIFVVELERTRLLTIRKHKSLWKGFVDDTISYIKDGFIEYVWSKLNSYHDNTRFIYEIEKYGKLMF